MMTAYEVQKERWIFKLALHLTGKSHQAYNAMAAEDACEYEHLKAAILKRDSINEETYHVHFRAVMDRLWKWMRECKSPTTAKGVPWRLGISGRKPIQ